MVSGYSFFSSSRPLAIDFTDYSRLPNDLVPMFASFSLTSARKGYVPTFSARICLLLGLNSIINLYFHPVVHEIRVNTQHENEAIG